MVRRVVSSIVGSRVFDLVYARVGSMVIQPIDGSIHRHRRRTVRWQGLGCNPANRYRIRAEPSAQLRLGARP